MSAEEFGHGHDTHALEAKWQRLGLECRLPGINPNSEIGKCAVEMAAAEDFFSEEQFDEDNFDIDWLESVIDKQSYAEDCMFVLGQMTSTMARLCEDRSLLRDDRKFNEAVVSAVRWTSKHLPNAVGGDKLRTQKLVTYTKFVGIVLSESPRDFLLPPA